MRKKIEGGGGGGGVWPTLDDTPGVKASSHPLPFGLHHCIAADDGKGDAVLEIKKSYTVAKTGS